MKENDTMKEKDIEYIVKTLRSSSSQYARFIRFMLIRFDEKWFTEKDSKGDANNEH